MFPNSDPKEEAVEGRKNIWLDADIIARVREKRVPAGPEGEGGVVDYVDQFRVCSSNGVFRGLPEEGDLYIGEMHRELLGRLEASVHSGRKPMSLLTGEAGAGKTTLAAVLHERLRGEEFSIVHVMVVGEDIDPALLKATRVIEGKPDMRPVSESALEAEFVRTVRKRSRSGGRRVVLILDDVQELSDRSLAELRDILNPQKADLLS